MKLLSVIVCAVMSIAVASAAPTFASFTLTDGSVLSWGPACTGAQSCTATVLFSYDGAIENNPPYDGTLTATLTYDWAPTGTVTSLGGIYMQNVLGDFSFSYTPSGGSPEDLATVDFSSATGLLFYNPYGGGLSLYVDPTTTAQAPIMTSSIVDISNPLNGWTFTVDFGNVNPGHSGGEAGAINPFSSAGLIGYLGASPYPQGQIPEPASMLMAGSGLITIGGLLRLKRRQRK